MNPLAALALFGLAAAAPPAPTTAPPTPTRPVWEARAATADAVEVKGAAYTVRPGDTLSHLVRKTGAGAAAIAFANGLKPPFTLRPGRTIMIPAGRYHLVRRGQSGIAIARAYGVDWSRVATLNHLVEPYQLRAGDRLLIPSRTEVAGMTLEQRAAAFRIDIDDLVTGAEPALAPKAKPAKPTAAPRPIAPTIPVAEPAGSFSGRFAWPLAGPRGAIVRPFGPLANGARNDGVNIATSRGTPILAAAAGVVAYAGPLAAFGQLVLIRHAGGWLTAYGHADSLLVTRGQAVTQGQPIARAGATGSASEPQLHFEIRQGRRPVNPLGLLR